MIHVRKSHPAFGLGSMRVVTTNHESVLAFVREYAGVDTQFGDSAESVLCVFSFAHNPVSVELSLDQFGGATTHDLFGGSQFPSVRDDGTLTLTLGAQSFFWLHLGEPNAERG
jgi:maltose alpha-D-glucosyltransferase/alpha-amylase